MTLLKINIDNRNGSSWKIYNATTLEPCVLDAFEPDNYKLFTNDVFTFNKGNVDIIHSAIRINENIPAVLILADQKTYGRENIMKMTSGSTFTKKKEGRLLYKCIPDDIRIPIFLVPYEMTNVGFSKVFTNLYVTIRYKDWSGKHPIANINQLIGSVDVLDNFYEYQLFCKSLNTSMQKFNKDTSKAIKEKAQEHDSFITTLCQKHPTIEDRTTWKTFTIDPPTSLDYDDGFSIKKLDNNQTLLSIYIANVTIWMDALNLWASFSERISTIYLPDRKRPMLPTILSDCLCSLQQGVRRFAFTMDILLDNTGTIQNITYSNSLIKVSNNFAYEEPALLVDQDYTLLFDCVKQLSQKYQYMHSIKNSHDVVCYLMIFMNYYSAQELLKANNGIFRSTIIKKQIELPTDLPDDVTQFIKIWNSASGQYIDLKTTTSNSQSIRHELLEMDAYIHLTSPIRRLVDLLNMIQFQQNHGLLQLTENATQFYQKWIAQLDYINTTMRAIRKVQNDCNLLHTCNTEPAILDKLYDGYCFDKLVRNDGLYQFIVFLPELKLTSRITMRDNLNNFDKRQYKLYLFNNEQKFKKKIRLQLV